MAMKTRQSSGDLMGYSVRLPHMGSWGIIPTTSTARQLQPGPVVMVSVTRQGPFSSNTLTSSLQGLSPPVPQPTPMGPRKCVVPSIWCTSKTACQSVRPSTSLA